MFSSPCPSLSFAFVCAGQGVHLRLPFSSFHYLYSIYLCNHILFCSRFIIIIIIIIIFICIISFCWGRSLRYEEKAQFKREDRATHAVTLSQKTGSCTLLFLVRLIREPSFFLPVKPLMCCLLWLLILNCL